MPRSGSTLVEQIISSHSLVNGAGELIYLRKHGSKLAYGTQTAVNKNISIFREKYLFDLAKRASGEHYVTDKTPDNFLFIPLICAAFPDAKIIHVKRDPKATCWSNFKHYFASHKLGYSYHLKDLVQYYLLYNDLMFLWQSQYVGKIYNLDYEKLIQEQENETRNLIEYLELSWEEACLFPEKNKRSVRTASQQQVRKKVYKGSSASWKKYRPFLNGAFDNIPNSQIITAL
jgi:hypothetical protein